MLRTGLMRFLVIALVLIPSLVAAQRLPADTAAPVYIVFATMAQDSTVAPIAHHVDSAARALLRMTSRVVPIDDPLARPRSTDGRPASLRFVAQLHVRAIARDSVVVRWRLIGTETGVLVVRDSMRIARQPSDAALDRVAAAAAYAIGRAATAPPRVRARTTRRL